MLVILMMPILLLVCSAERLLMMVRWVASVCGTDDGAVGGLLVLVGGMQVSGKRMEFHVCVSSGSSVP
jgi:hypothetical protein